MKTVLITGAMGYIGARLSLYMRDIGYEVIAVNRSLPSNKKKLFGGIKCIEGDLTDPTVYNKLFASSVHVVIHTVSLDQQTCESVDVEELSKVNITATWRLLERSCKENIEKFIYLSTTQVLGDLATENFREEQAVFPKNKYALTHAVCEDLVKFYHLRSQTDCISVRLSNGYGAPVFKDNNCWHLVLNSLCKTAFQQAKIVLNSNGTAVRDFIHIMDVVKAIEILAQKNDSDCNLYNIASGQTVSLLRVAHMVKSVYQKRYNKEIPVYHSTDILSDFQPERSGNYVIDTNRLLQTGYTIEYNLETGIDELFSYLEKEYYETKS